MNNQMSFREGVALLAEKIPELVPNTYLGQSEDYPSYPDDLRELLKPDGCLNEFYSVKDIYGYVVGKIIIHDLKSKIVSSISINEIENFGYDLEPLYKYLCAETKGISLAYIKHKHK